MVKVQNAKLVNCIQLENEKESNLEHFSFFLKQLYFKIIDIE